MHPVLRGLFSAAVWFFLVVWSVIWMTVAIAVTLLSFSASISLWMARRIWSPGIFWAAGIKLQIEPLPSLDWSKPYIFVMNHQSNLDIPAAFIAIPRDLRFIAKHTLFYVPFLGLYMWLAGMIFVNRSHRTKAMESLRRAGERIRAGSNILAFPEGTRSRDGKIHPFKKGPFVVALEARVPIIPVAVEGSGRVQPANSWMVRSGTIRINIGQPIPTEGRTIDDRDALMRDVHAALCRLHEDIGGAGGAADAIAPPGTQDADVPRLATAL